MPNHPACAIPALTAAVALVLTALAAPSQAAPQSGPSGNPVSIPVTPEQARAEVEETRRLNREQAAFAERQLAENAAAKRAYEEAVAERAANIARQQAEYEAALAAHRSEREQREREHARTMERWRADVAACEAGDWSRCARRNRRP
jgi:hypothetical protein